MGGGLSEEYNEEEGGRERETGCRETGLCEGEPGLVVDLEDLLDGVDVRRRPEVQTQVIAVSRTHDLLRDRQTQRGTDRQTLDAVV